MNLLFAAFLTAVVSACHVSLPAMGLGSLQDLCSHWIPKHLAQCLADGPQLNRKEGREGGKEEGRKSRRERGMEGPINLF